MDKHFTKMNPISFIKCVYRITCSEMYFLSQIEKIKLEIYDENITQKLRKQCDQKL